jgi:pyruvate dehydrogenase E1 component
MTEKLVVPDIGDFQDVEVIEILVKEGDQIKINDPVVTIESDKSSVEIPSTVSGKIKNIAIKVGDKVSKDDLLLNVSSTGKSLNDQPIPKDTESIINQAEAAMVQQKEEAEIIQKPVQKKEQSVIQVTKRGDIDPLETQDWLESLSAVISKDGNQRAHFLIKELINKAYREGANIPYTQNTPYINTIPPEAEVKSNGDQNIERRIRSLIRWNAAAMVVRANKKFPELGGHIGTFASAATLYDVGMNHFWRAKNDKFGGDLVYFQ